VARIPNPDSRFAPLVMTRNTAMERRMLQQCVIERAFEMRNHPTV
jgi:hypothetical protein